MTPRTDHDLLQEFAAGDREAYAVLVARHEGLVRCACRRQAPSTDLDDCIQAVFLVLARRPRAAARAPALEAWLLRVAWFVCQRARRRQQRRRRAEAAAVQPTETISATPPEALEHLDDCLARLPERQRIAVGLHYLGDKPADEVARILGVSRDNAYQLLSRGLAGLRTLMSRRGIVVGEAALVLLFAGEAKAATATALTGTSSLTATLAGSPSAGALSLSHGASVAMTLAALAPAGLAAGILLPLTVATLALTMEPTPPAPVVTSTPAPVGAAQTPAPTTPSGIDTIISLDVHDMPLQDVLTRVSTSAQVNVVLDPRIKKTACTLRLTGVTAGEALAQIAKGLDADVRQIAGAHFLCKKDRPEDTRPRLILDGIDDQRRKQLDQRISLDFKALPVVEVHAYLQQLTSFNLILGAELAAAEHPPVTFQAQDMTLADAMHWIAVLTDASIVWQSEAFAFKRYPADEAPRPVTERCDWTGIDKIPHGKEILAQRLTCDFQDQPLTDVVEFIHKVSGLDLTLMPGSANASPTVTLRVDKMRLDDVIRWIAELTGSTVRVSDGAVVVVRPGNS